MAHPFNSTLAFPLPAMSLASLSATHMLVLAGTGLTLYFATNAVYQLFFSPLRHIPGPWYAAVSELWFLSNLARLRQCKTVHDLFEKYGPIVRYAPNKVAYLDAASNKRVYMGHKWSKGPQYKGFMINDHDWSMTLLPHSEHVVHKKAYAPHYTAANAALFQPETQTYVLDTVEILEELSGKTSVDTLVLFGEAIADIICAVNFGCKAGVLESWGAPEGKHWLIRCIDDFPKRSFVRIVSPNWLFNLYYAIPIKRWQLFLDCNKTMGEFVSERVKEARAQLQDGKLDEIEKLSLVQRLIQLRLPSGALASDDDVVTEVLGHLVAGVETTATMLSYACWEISRRPDIARRIQAEVDNVMPDPKTIPDVTVLNSLEFLNAFLKETLRIYSPGPGLLQRVAPAEGKGSEPVTLFNCVIPGGTVVATQAYSLHRNPAVFPYPAVFNPDRWLVADEAELLAMNTHMMAFGGGLRVCGGQNFAMQTIRTMLATVVRNFTVLAPPETNAYTMEMVDGVVAFPRGMHCKLVFHPRKQ